MPTFIEWLEGVFGAIGPENLGVFLVFVGGTGATVWAGIKRERKPATVAVEPLAKRVERLEAENANIEERQMMSDGRLARVEGELGVVRSLVERMSVR